MRSAIFVICFLTSFGVFAQGEVCQQAMSLADSICNGKTVEKEPVYIYEIISDEAGSSSQRYVEVLRQNIESICENERKGTLYGGFNCLEGGGGFGHRVCSQICKIPVE